MASIIIPAHNESNSIDRCLSTFIHKNNSENNRFEVIVVCNGCDDDTAAKARKYSGVTVLETDEASKVYALNKGDSIATSYPRVYMDADIEISYNDLLTAIQKMQNSELLAASPKAKYIMDSSDLWVRCFYTVWTRLPYFTKGNMTASGVYILSKKGRSRFSTFPNVVSDDGYIRTLFKDSEQETLEDSVSNVFVPRRVKDLIKIKRRSLLGNRQLTKNSPKTNIGRDNTVKDIIILVCRKPWLVPAAIVYVVIIFQIRIGIALNRKADSKIIWERDNSSRC